MIHPIADLQAKVIAALNADAALLSSIGSGAIFDMPPKGKAAPYVVIARHDILTRNTDLEPGNDHRLHIQIWHTDPSREAVLTLAERVQAVLTTSDLSSATLKVTNVQHERTQSAIDRKTGQARAVLIFRIFSEPAV